MIAQVKSVLKALVGLEENLKMAGIVVCSDKNIKARKNTSR